MTDFQSLSLSTMVRLYNEITGESVARFTNREKACRRLSAALERGNLRIVMIDGVAKAQPIEAPVVEGPAPKARKAAIRFVGELTLVEIVANPKKPGSRAFSYFAQYRAGQTVSDFIAACIASGLTEKDARANLSWDARKGFVKLG